MKEKKSSTVCFTLVLFLFLLFCVPSWAAEFYVSPAGSDGTGNGTISLPYGHIQHVLDNVALSGDVIILRGGQYNENIRIRNSNMTIRSEIDEWAVIQSVIDTNDENRDIAVIFDVDSNGSRLQRVEVVGGNYYGIKFQTKWDYGDPNDRSGASSIIIEDCIIHDTGNACIKVTPGCDDITIRRCEIYNSGRDRAESAEAIDNVNGDRMRVEQCYIHDITDTGLYAKGGAMGMLVDRCLVKDCDGAGILVGFDTSPEFFDLTVNPGYYENINGLVQNCVIINTQYAGIGMYAAQNPKIYNNTIVNAAQDDHAGLYFGVTFQDWEPEAGRPASINPIICNNIVVQSGDANPMVMAIRYADELEGLSGLSGMPAMSNNCYHVTGVNAGFEDNRPGHEFSGGLDGWQAHISGDAGSMETNPAFKASASDDYSLSAGSTCVDAGTSSGAPTSDYDGITRPQGLEFDIGAYEYIYTGEPFIHIRINDANDSLVISEDTSIVVSLGLDCGSYSNINADWWIVELSPAGILNYFDLNRKAMVKGLLPSYQGPLFSLDLMPILTLSGLTTGEHVYFFGIDRNMNGALDVDTLLYDMITVTVAPIVETGHVTYTFEDQVYRIKAEPGAIPENISQKLDNLSPLPQGGSDENLNISPDGNWLALITERFDPDCAGWACLALVANDVSSGEVVRINGEVIHSGGGMPVIASGGNLIIYHSREGTHTINLWAVRRDTSASPWDTPVELTKSSNYAYNEWPAINDDGSKILFNCTDEPYSNDTNICEVGTDAKNFHVLVRPGDSPAVLPDVADLHSPDYAPDGSIVFEADWDGENIWRLAAGANQPIKITDDFNNDNSPCVLPDGSIASLWLNRPGGSDYHELKVMRPDGSSYFMLITGQDIDDIGLGCGH